MAVSVSDEFKTAIQSNARKIYSRVKINFTDLFLDPTSDVILSTTEWLDESGDTWTTEAGVDWITEDNNSLYSFEDQVVNGRRGATKKWGSMDGVTIMDGSYYYAPGTAALASFNEIGWWGNVISDINGAFPYDQVISIEFSSRNVTRMDIAADDKRDEYPVDFEYEFFDGSAVSLGTYSVTGNSLALRSDTVDFTGVEKITLTITKWSTAGTNVKITELSSVLEQVFEDDVTESIQVTEQREISNNNSIPIGNIAASESSVTLVNKNRQFDANNVDSPFYGTVRPGSRVRVEIGVRLPDDTVEFVQVFSGWSVSWAVPEQSITASTTARDRLELLTRTEITATAVIIDDTFGDWFETVLADAGLSSTEYEIDTVLYGTDYTVPYGWLEKQTHRAALELLAVGCAGSVYQDREGIIQVEAWDYLQRNKTTAEASYSRSDYMDKGNQPVYEGLANKITVTTQPRVAASSSTVYETSASEPEEINPSDVEEFTISYEDTPVINGSASVDPVVSGVTVTDATYYAWGAVIEVTNSNGTGQQFQLKVTGQVLNVQGRQTITAINQDSIDENGEYAYVFPGNIFLQKKALSLSIVDGLIDIFSEPQRDLTIAFSPGGSPALELGDKVNVIDKYQEKNYNLVGTDISYDGGLSIRHKARVVTQFEPWLTEAGESWCTEDGEDWLISQFIVNEPWFTETGDEWITEDGQDWESNRLVV